jgi:hypothetical protein
MIVVSLIKIPSSRVVSLVSHSCQAVQHPFLPVCLGFTLAAHATSSQPQPQLRYQAESLAALSVGMQLCSSWFCGQRRQQLGWYLLQRWGVWAAVHGLVGAGGMLGLHPCGSRYVLAAAVVATVSGGSIGGIVCGWAAVRSLVLRAAAAAAAVGLAAAVGCRGSHARPGWGRRCAWASPLRRALHTQATAVAPGGSIGGIVCGRGVLASEATQCPLKPCYFDKWDIFADT